MDRRKLRLEPVREKQSLKLRMPRGCIPADHSILEIIGRINSEFLSPDLGIRRGPPFLHTELHAHAIPQRTLGGLVLAAAPAACSALGVFRRKPFGVDRLGVSQRRTISELILIAFLITTKHCTYRACFVRIFSMPPPRTR